VNAQAEGDAYPRAANSYSDVNWHSQKSAKAIVGRIFFLTEGLHVKIREGPTIFYNESDENSHLKRTDFQKIGGTENKGIRV
jgi:hypothetical protein